MNRTALRLATLAALSNGGAAPFPTIAGACVFDSRQDPIDDLVADERRPVIVIRTDEDRRDTSSPSGTSVRSVLSRQVEMRIEFGVVTASVDPETGTLIVGWPESEAGLEALLDRMEFEIEAALRGYGAWARWFQDVGAWGLLSWSSSQVFTDPDEGRVRLAARELSLRFRLHPECFPKPRHQDDAESDATMPQLLASVLARIDAKGGGDLKIAAAEIAGVLNARTWPEVETLPALRRVVATIPEPLDPPTGEDDAALVEAELSGDRPDA